MASYACLFVTAGASPVTDETTVIDIIEAFTKDTWTVTARIKSDLSSTAAYDCIVFPEAGIFTGDWDNWDAWDLPLIIPENRVNVGDDETAASSGARSGSHTVLGVISGVTTDEIVVDSGLATTGTSTFYSVAEQILSDATTFGSGWVHLWNDDNNAAEKTAIGYIESGGTMSTGTAANRRAYVVGQKSLTGDGLDAFESTMRWLVDGFVVDQTITLPANMGLGTVGRS